jgi:hypothetical protein
LLIHRSRFLTDALRCGDCLSDQSVKASGLVARNLDG